MLMYIVFYHALIRSEPDNRHLGFIIFYTISGLLLRGLTHLIK
jgi:peptidoglycan/LPS O-acetylase OafA/YrhL